MPQRVDSSHAILIFRSSRSRLAPQSCSASVARRCVGWRQVWRCRTGRKAPIGHSASPYPMRVRSVVERAERSETRSGWKTGWIRFGKPTRSLSKRRATNDRCFVRLKSSGRDLRITARCVFQGPPVARFRVPLLRLSEPGGILASVGGHRRASLLPPPSACHSTPRRGFW